MSYTISSALNKNKVFILPKSELVERLDPTWYIYLKSIQGFKHDKIAFKKLLLESPQYGANEIGIERETNSEPRYIRITDINEFGELENELGKTAATIEEKYFLKENDLLLARSGNTVGKSYLHKEVGYDCFFAGYMIRFKIDTNKVLPNYIFTYTQTDFYKRWVKAIQRTTGQPNINAEEYKNLEIPLPKISIQQKIVSIYFGFLNQKQQNEAAAGKLLASIDDYLLKELGVNLPIPPENTLQNRMFTSSIIKLSGSRLDPHFHQEKFKQLDLQLKKGKYPLSNLKKKAVLITSGATPLSKGDSYTEDVTNGIPFIRSGEIKDISFEDCIYIKPEIHNTMLKSSQLKKGDLLIAIVGATIGEVGIFNHNREANINQAIALVRLNNELLPPYAKEFYKSSIGNFILDRAKRPVARANINLDEIGVLPIPVPPISKQQEIVGHITAIRQQAQQLKDQTKLALAQANAAIEKILLG